MKRSSPGAPMPRELRSQIRARARRTLGAAAEARDYATPPAAAAPPGRPGATTAPRLADHTLGRSRHDARPPPGQQGAAAPARRLDGLEAALSRRAAERAAPRREALLILASLEGALIVARTLDRAELFDQIAEALSGGESGPA